MPRPPKFREFHRSLTAELEAIHDRLAHLVGNRLTSGEYRESALRMMLRRHLPPSLVVGRGFIVTNDDVSAQIDVLIVDGTCPFLYRDGDLLVVTPDMVRAIVEVKTGTALTSLSDQPAEIVQQMISLAKKGAFCQGARRGRDTMPKVWTGLFVFDGLECPSDEPVLNAIAVAKQQTSHSVNCVALGKSRFVRYWSLRDIAPGGITGRSPFWDAYDFRDRDVAPSYFLGNVIESVAGVYRTETGCPWFPLSEGKEPYRTGTLHENDLRIEIFLADPQ